MPRYKVKGRLKESGGKSERTYYAADGESAAECACEDGVFVDEVEEIEPKPATASQCSYASSLGTSIPLTATVDEASDIISCALNDDEPASAELLRLAAEEYKIFTTRFTGKALVYRQIFKKLLRTNDERALVRWFAFNVYQDRLRRKNLEPLKGLYDFRLFAICNRLANTPKVIGSIKRYKGKDLMRFGNRQAEEDASIRYLGSTRTIAYKATIKLVNDRIELDEPSPVLSRSSAAESDVEDLKQALLEGLIAIPLLVPLYWLISKFW